MLREKLDLFGIPFDKERLSWWQNAILILDRSPALSHRGLHSERRWSGVKHSPGGLPGPPESTREVSHSP
jgi:hypothetical protein